MFLMLKDVEYIFQPAFGCRMDTINPYVLRCTYLVAIKHIFASFV